MIYTRPSIHQSLSFILAMSSPRTTRSFSHFSQWRQQPTSLLLMKMVNQPHDPVGIKRVKQMKKEDEMVDRLSQKFGILLNKTTNNEETTQMKMTTKNSPVLQEALAGFLSITGQGMSAWMMQSMSNSTRDKIKKDADERMKQQILKIIMTM